MRTGGRIERSEFEPRLGEEGVEHVLVGGDILVKRVLQRLERDANGD